MTEGTFGRTKVLFRRILFSSASYRKSLNSYLLETSATVPPMTTFALFAVAMPFRQAGFATQAAFMVAGVLSSCVTFSKVPWKSSSDATRLVRFRTTRGSTPLDSSGGTTASFAKAEPERAIPAAMTIQEEPRMCTPLGRAR